MGNGVRRDPVLMWLIGAMFVVILGLAGAVSTHYSGRLDRMEGKIDAIQREYGRIAALEGQVKEGRDEQRQLREKIDELFRENRKPSRP